MLIQPAQRAFRLYQGAAARRMMRQPIWLCVATAGQPGCVRGPRFLPRR